MAESIVNSRFRQAFADAFLEIAKFMEIDILKAFDNEHGYDESGNRVSWPSLGTGYVMSERGGSAHPILVRDGDLRAAVKVIADKSSITTDVTSSKMKERGGPGTISVAEISADLGIERPHTNPSSKWLPGSSNVRKIIDKHLWAAYNELRRDGLWTAD